jgi:hypothetical protein
VTPVGTPTDSPRRFPTLLQLARRVLSRAKGPDYAGINHPVEVDWVGGMFMVFPREAYSTVGGFDERFFMYMEDVDICRRLHDSGREVWFDPRCEVTHDAQRRNRRDMRHLRWHVASLARYLFLYGVTTSWSHR